MDNLLIIGTSNKSAMFLSDLDFSSPFLLIDDGSLIDKLHIPPRRKVHHFNWKKDSLNPLQGMDYKGARDFISILNEVFPEGSNTLTRKNSNFLLLNALSHPPPRLDHLFREQIDDDPHYQDAQQKIQTLLLSPVLKRVLCNRTNFPLTGVVLARISRAELGDFDAFVLANMLIQHFPGQIVISDGGFYLREHHITLIQQKRLTVGVNFLDEVGPQLKNALISIKKKVAYRLNPFDARQLTVYFPGILNPDILMDLNDGEFRTSW